jgi:hypothetical protein
MRLRRVLLLAVVGGGLLAAGLAFAQTPPLGSAANGWLQSIFNVLGDGVTTGGPRTQITASTTGTTAATTATLAATSTTTTFICGFSINSTATAAAAGNATVTGTITGTLNYEMGTGTSPAVVITSQTFNPCVAASGKNQAIAVVSAAPGAGGVISVTATGYQR